MSPSILEGRWRIVKAVSGGVEGATPEGTYLFIQGDVFERQTPDYTYKRRITLNTNRHPFQIDLHITNEPHKGSTFLGLFKLEADTLYIAHSLPNHPRPVDFESTQENKQILSISVRQK